MHQIETVIGIGHEGHAECPVGRGGVAVNFYDGDFARWVSGVEGEVAEPAPAVSRRWVSGFVNLIYVFWGF